MTTQTTTTTTAAGGDAVARYRYLLSTSSPDQIEQAHEEAFAAMSAQERQQVLTALSGSGETPADASSSSLARAATRLEMRKPGTLSGVLGSGRLGAGGTVLASLAAGFVGSAVWGSLTGGDGVGGRPGLLSRLFGRHRGFGAGGGTGPFDGGVFRGGLFGGGMGAGRGRAMGAGWGDGPSGGSRGGLGRGGPEGGPGGMGGGMGGPGGGPGGRF